MTQEQEDKITAVRQFVEITSKQQDNVFEELSKFLGLESPGDNDLLFDYVFNSDFFKNEEGEVPTFGSVLELGEATGLHD